MVLLVVVLMAAIPIKGFRVHTSSHYKDNEYSTIAMQGLVWHTSKFNWSDLEISLRLLQDSACDEGKESLSIQ